MGTLVKQEEKPDSPDDTDSLPWSHTDPAFLSFRAQLQEDPAPIIGHVRKLYAGRARGSGNAELCEQMMWLQMALDDPEELSARTWFALVKSEGLLEMYIQLAQTDGFFNEEPVLVAAVFAGLANVAKGCRDVEDFDSEFVLLSHCTALFRAVWESRELLKRIVPEENGFYVEGHPVIWCMFHFADLHNSIRGYPAGVETFIPHVALFGWVCLRDVHFSLTGLHLLTEGSRPLTADAFDRFIQEALLDIGGAEAVFVRFEEALNEKHQDEDAFEVMATMAKLVEHPSLRPLLQQRKTFTYIVALLDRRYRSNKLSADDRHTAWLEWTMALALFKCALVNEHSQCAQMLIAEKTRSIVSEDLRSAYYKEDMSGITFRGEDAIAFLARGAGWIAQAASRREFNNLVRIADKCVEIAEALRMYCFVATSHDWRERAPVFTDGLQRGARAEWMPTLDALRVGGHRLGTLSGPYSDLVNAWTLFGAAMGLDESREQKEARKYCSYQLCTFHMQVPSGVLLTCKGCGTVRYCGKECQRGDWRAHKRVCGTRLK